MAGRGIHAAAALKLNPGQAHAWDVKHLVRTIVTSHTYRQSSMTTPELQERDPDNRLLARQSRFRVDAEIVHDIALSVSGLLVESFGGPSVRPYQPDGYLAAVNFPKREYSASHGDDLYRRALYTQWQRTFLHPTLLTFDAPTREECGVNRVNSNTPLQALVLLNDPIFRRSGPRFRGEYIKSRRSLGRRNWIGRFRRALNRAPNDEERGVLSGPVSSEPGEFRIGSVECRSNFYRVGEAPLPPGADRVNLAALTTIARAILNLHETITRN